MDAAKLIWDCWQNGKKIKQLPKKISPNNRSESYAIQSLYEKFSGDQNLSVGTPTSLDGQKHIGVSGPLVGRILHDRVFSPNAKLNFGGNKMAVAEPEFAFKMGSALGPLNIL